MRLVLPIPYLILKGEDSISHYSIKSRGVEESGIGIPISKPIHYGFQLPEVLYILKDRVQLLNQVVFQI